MYNYTYILITYFIYVIKHKQTKIYMFFCMHESARLVYIERDMQLY